MAEWRLYLPVVDRFRREGYHVASQVTDPKATRIELDVVAFAPDLAEVHVVEVKETASKALADQCRDRLRYARRVWAAVPAGQGGAMADQVEEVVGVLAIGDGDVREIRAARATDDHLETGQAHRLERMLRTALAEGTVEPPRHG